MIARRFFLAVALAVMCALTAAQDAEAQIEIGPTLSEILKRGFVICGMTEADGFAEPLDGNEWRGFDVDICRALASAIFDDPTKVMYSALPAKERAASLQGNWVDLLASGAPWTQSRDTGQRIIYAGVSLYDGQTFLVRRQRSFASARDLSGVSVCVQRGTSYELTLADFFNARRAPYEPRAFETFEEAAAGYEAGKCDALTADASMLYAARAKFASPADHAVLPDMLSKAPRGPVVRQGDDQWLNIVRWTLYAMINAEELQVSILNADLALKSENPDIRRLVGVDGDLGASLGLAKNWAFRIIKHIGNYGDMFDRNLGPATPMAMDRRINALWSNGGLMYAPPVR